MGVPPACQYPGIARRLASMVYECLLLLGVLAVGFLLPQVIYAMIAGRPAAQWVLLVHVITIMATYFVWFWRHGGQTVAMRTWKIRLENAHDSAPLSLPRATLRFLFCWPSLGVFGAGIFWALCDRDRQFLHDRLAGTRLVKIN